MTFTVSPTTHWHEYPATRSSLRLAGLVAYLLTDGSVEFFESGDTIPGGAVVATVRDSGDGTDEIVTPMVSAGRRPTQNSAGEVFLL